MAGHSKWTNIRHRRERQDTEEGKIFTKLIRELTVAARQGSGVPADNPHLCLAVDRTLTANIIRSTVNRVVIHGVGSNDVDNMVKLSYESYASSGVAIIVEAITDNRNRTAAEVCHAFSKCDGNLDTDGSVACVFERKGQISLTPGVDGEALMDAALEAGADNMVVNDDGSIDAFTAFTDFISVNEAPAAAGFKGDEAEVVMILLTTATLGLETAQKMLKLIDVLEGPDDVQNVYSNVDIPDNVMAQLSWADRNDNAKPEMGYT